MPKNKLYSLTVCVALALSAFPCGVVSAEDVAIESERVTLAMILPAPCPTVRNDGWKLRAPCASIRCCCAWMSRQPG